jgi:hypothetical protein
MAPAAATKAMKQNANTIMPYPRLQYRNLRSGESRKKPPAVPEAEGSSP